MSKRAQELFLAWSDIDKLESRERKLEERVRQKSERRKER